MFFPLIHRAGHCFAPVSYTHLDVYKRQRPHGLVSDAHGQVGAVAAGNVHALQIQGDVYKRQEYAIF